MEDKMQATNLKSDCHPYSNAYNTKNALSSKTQSTQPMDLGDGGDSSETD